jgi:hypothetical protein
LDLSFGLSLPASPVDLAADFLAWLFFMISCLHGYESRWLAGIDSSHIALQI